MVIHDSLYRKKPKLNGFVNYVVELVNGLGFIEPGELGTFLEYSIDKYKNLTTVINCDGGKITLVTNINDNGYYAYAQTTITAGGKDTVLNLHADTEKKLKVPQQGLRTLVSCLQLSPYEF